MADSRRLSIPPGDFRVVAGMYELATMKRLPADGGDNVVLFDLKVSP